jgi:hypothetical protein
MRDDRNSVHLNLASQEDLEALASVGGHAAAIVDHRPFRDWSDLRRAGLFPEEIDRIKASGVGLGAPSEGPIGEPGSGGSADSASGNLGRA